MVYDNKKNIITEYTDTVYSMVKEHMKLKNEDDIAITTSHLEDILQSIKRKNPNFEFYFQTLVSEENNELSIFNVFSSKYEELNNTYSYYDKNSKIGKYFYPTLETLDELEKHNLIHGEETFYDKDDSLSKKRIFFSRYVPEHKIIITTCFYDNTLKAEAKEYSTTLSVENKRDITIFFTFMIFIIISLFLLLCYIETVYYKRLSDKYEHEKEKTTEKYNKLKKLSQLDGLTKCFNRKYLTENMKINFDNFLDGHLTSTTILFDIDNFKSINDTYGHMAGDEVLKQVSKTVKECVRKEDIVARWGGEEFIVFFKYTSLPSAFVVAEKIRLSIENLTITTPNEKIKVTVSIGVSNFKKTDTNETDSIKRADDAMYISKTTGKNKVTIYED